jgi:NAD(P)-dependent dehydrogenase (short-subunit alcohol dehydrogenase family)
MRRLAERQSLFDSESAEFRERLRLIELDVTRDTDRRVALKLVEREQGRLDILVNNAGFGVFGPLEDAPEALVREQLEVNFFGTLFLTQAALPLLRASRGRIIAVSSILGSVATPFTSLYSASKFALEGLFEALAAETEEAGVQIALVLPGAHRTSFGANLRQVVAPGSVYAQAAERSFRMMRGRPDSKRPPAAKVVSAVLRLLECRRMPLRTFVGPDALALHYLHSLLPQSIFQPLLRGGIRLASQRMK